MTQVRELLEGKPHRLLWTHPGASVFEALETMASHDIGALPVLEDERLVGILSERDYARGIALTGRRSRDTKVGELMVATVDVGPGDSIKHCMTLMTSRRVRHLTVVEDGRLIGIVTIGDVVKQIISRQAGLISDLQDYIRGS
jgi:CBS domain-containing protein